MKMTKITFFLGAICGFSMALVAIFLGLTIDIAIAATLIAAIVGFFEGILNQITLY